MRITREVPACLCSQCWVPRGFWGPVRALLQPPITAQHAEIRPRRWRASLQQCWLMKMTVEEKRTVMRRFKKKVTRVCLKVQKHGGALHSQKFNDFCNNCRSCYPGTGVSWRTTACNVEGALGKTWKKYEPCVAAGHLGLHTGCGAGTQCRRTTDLCF